MEAMIGAAGHEHWWFVFPLVWLAVILLFWGLFWRGRWRHHGEWHHGPSAEQVLGERYARGEISEEEYRQRRTVLRER